VTFNTLSTLMPSWVIYQQRHPAPVGCTVASYSYLLTKEISLEFTVFTKQSVVRSSNTKNVSVLVPSLHGRALELQTL
jgi:hypothetical protein